MNPARSSPVLGQGRPWPHRYDFKVVFILIVIVEAVMVLVKSEIALLMQIEDVFESASFLEAVKFFAPRQHGGVVVGLETGTEPT